LNVLKQNPSLAEEQIDLGKVAAKVTEKVATEGAPKPSAPHTKPSTKPSTKPKITNQRKPSSSRCKRPLDTVYKKADSLVPATAQTTPQPPARAPKKPKLPAQPETRAPPASRGCQQEVPKRVTKSTARAQRIDILDKKMHQLRDHFNKHGRIMGYESKKTYDAAAKAFAKINQNNPSTKIFDGVWNGKGKLSDTFQRAISYEGKTVILDKNTGQVIDFYKGSELRGLIKLVEVK